MWEKISKALKTILDANTLLDNVYDFESTNIKGTPVASITPSAIDSEYSTTTENQRVYAFTVRLFMQRLSSSDDENTAEKAMRELVDTVFDDLDKNHRLSALESETGYTFLFMEAATGPWGYAGRENEYRIADIDVRCHFAIDVNVVT